MIFANPTIYAEWTQEAEGADSIELKLLSCDDIGDRWVWALGDVATVDAAVAQVAARITSQVTGFTAIATTATTVAGQPAVHLTGTGTEADDGDPSNVEVDIFRAGGQVILLLSHGEGASPGATKGTIDALLATLPTS